MLNRKRLSVALSLMLLPARCWRLTHNVLTVCGRRPSHAGSERRAGLFVPLREYSKDGVFHGLHGTASEPGSLQIDGKIGATVLATVCNRPYRLERVCSGPRYSERNEYGYNIEAKFEASTGAGRRIEGRPAHFNLRSSDALIDERGEAGWRTRNCAIQGISLLVIFRMFS